MFFTLITTALIFPSFAAVSTSVRVSGLVRANEVRYTPIRPWEESAISVRVEPRSERTPNAAMMTIPINTTAEAFMPFSLAAQDRLCPPIPPSPGGTRALRGREPA